MKKGYFGNVLRILKNSIKFYQAVNKKKCIETESYSVYVDKYVLMKQLLPKKIKKSHHQENVRIEYWSTPQYDSTEYNHETIKIMAQVLLPLEGEPDILLACCGTGISIIGEGEEFRT